MEGTLGEVRGLWRRDLVRTESHLAEHVARGGVDGEQVAGSGEAG